MQAEPIEIAETDSEELPRTRLMLNMADPATAFRCWRLGVGLARMEFVISDHVKAHPIASSRSSATWPADAGSGA